MKHWPSFEPFEEAADSSSFLALWPSIVADEPAETGSGAPVEAEPRAGKVAGSPTPPTVDPADETVSPPRSNHRRFPSLLVLLSLAVHAAALVLTAHFLTQPGVEAETDAISVEIVVDAPPNPSTDPSLAGVAATEADEADEVEPDKATVSVPSPALSLPPTPPDVETTQPAATTAVEVPKPELSLPPEPPAFDAPKVLATRQIAEEKVPAPALLLPEVPPKTEAEQPARPATEVVEAVPPPALKLPDAAPQIPDGAELPVTLPGVAPLPAPAPDQPNPIRKAEKPVPVSEDVEPVRSQRNTKPDTDRKTSQHQAVQAPKETRKTADRPSSSGVGKVAGRGSVASRGGASAGEKAAYAARLRSHVQRFERYPAEAERNGVTGAARIAITIDRSGRLLSSRLAGSSGSAVLDDAARATAERASPYPPPPDGIGGRTLTFAATVRFRR
ncbi:TonB family protein [Mesorhizobium koreense]|uniref:TonB family protein n=1 Tax=Mesorhizobium koreense TaxID=3074855 RepID=UPI00287BC142|nr:TonB family protein [Mesorhizobium sp. WR6]